MTLEPKKHPCPDCTFCQWCSDDRCRLCRGGHACHGKKLSLAEQIALYDEINRTPVAAGPAITTDALRSLDLVVTQPKEGYRFSIDPLLLADFAWPDAGENVIDLGTGCSIIPLVMARRVESARFIGVEFQTCLAREAKENVIRNRLSGQISILEKDIMTLREDFSVSSFDRVVCNPPYRKPGTGKLSPRPGRDQARHESTAGLVDFLATAKYLVKPTGRISFVYLPERLQEFFQAASSLKLSALRIRFVHGTLDASARMFLVELVKGRTGTLDVLPPLILHDSKGGYTPELNWLS